jgi:hypothetical protein
MRPEAKLKIRYTEAKRHAGGNGDNSLRKHSQYERISKTV